MDFVKGIVVAAAIIDAAKNLYELTFSIPEDPAKERSLKFQTNKYNKKIKRYTLTIEGNRIIDIEPED